MADNERKNWTTDTLIPAKSELLGITNGLGIVVPTGRLRPGDLCGVVGKLGRMLVLHVTPFGENEIVVGRPVHDGLGLHTITDLTKTYAGRHHVWEDRDLPEPKVIPDPTPDDPERTFTIYTEHVYLGLLPADYYGWAKGDTVVNSGAMYPEGSKLS